MGMYEDPFSTQRNNYSNNPYNLPVMGTWKPEDNKNPNILGSDFDYLKGLVGNQLAGDPNKGLYRQLFNKQLGTQQNRAVKNINEQLSSSGFRGAGANLIGDVFEQGANATQGFEGDLMKNDFAIKQNAIGQLLGLNQFEGNQNFGMFQSDRQQGQFDTAQANQMSMFNQQLQFQKDNQPSWWESILGSLIGGGAQVGAAALTGGASAVGGAAAALSDARLKENIKKVSKRGDIDIVEFNYIGNPQRFRGVTAQQIEANHPEAVREINGIKFVDYSKIDVKMEAI